MKSLETQGKKLREIFFYSLVMEEVFCNTRLVLYRTGMEESLKFNEMYRNSNWFVFSI